MLERTFQNGHPGVSGDGRILRVSEKKKGFRRVRGRPHPACFSE
jgi:hypothetical protein